MALTRLFSYDSRTTLHGAVAQLGERLNGIQEVESSILFGSMRKRRGRPRKPPPPLYFVVISPRPRTFFSSPPGAARGNRDRSGYFLNNIS